MLLQLTVTSSVVQRVGVLGLALTAPALLTVGGGFSALTGASFGVVVVLKATDSPCVIRSGASPPSCSGRP